MKVAEVLSVFEYDSMPSMSEVLIPASAAALRSAHVPRARVVLSDPRVKVVSPTPTIAYLSRRYFGVLTSVSAGSGMAHLPFRDCWFTRNADPCAICRQ